MAQDLTPSKLVHTPSDIEKDQRSERGTAYESMVKKYHALRANAARGDKKAKGLYDALVADIEDIRLATKGVSPSSVHSNTFLTNLSVMYSNDEYIGERLVTPVPVSKRTDSYAIYPQRERLEFPSDVLGERSLANEISESRTSSTYALLDYGLSNFVSQMTLDNQDPVFDEMADLTMALNEAIAFKRELRLATLLTTAGNYGSGNTTTLSGSDQWDSAAGGNPLKDIQDGIAALWRGPGQTKIVGFTSLPVFNHLSRHPLVLDSLKYNRSGLANRQELANLVGLDELIVSSARKQTANEGQTAAYSRIWGLDFGIVRVATVPSKRTASFAALFRENGDPVTTEWFDPASGKKGGYHVKIGVSESAQVVASFAGYLIKAASSA